MLLVKPAKFETPQNVFLAVLSVKDSKQLLLTFCLSTTINNFDCCVCLLCRTTKPCLSTDASTVCVPTYGFRHILPLVANPVEFEVCILKC